MWKCDNCETKNDERESYCKVCGNAQYPKTIDLSDTQKREESSSGTKTEQSGKKFGSNTLFENMTAKTERSIKKVCALFIIGGIVGLCMCCLEVWLSAQSDGYLKYIHGIMILVMMYVGIAGFTYGFFTIQTTFLYDDHVESRIKLMNSKMKVKYHQIKLVLETKGLYLLWGDFHGCTVISKNGFTKGTTKEFERFICSKAVNAKIKLL